MKKIIATLVITTGLLFGNAQDDDAKFRFGLKIVPSFNWLKIDDERTFEKNGTAMKFGYGLIAEFHLAGAAWLSTGFQVDYDGGKIKTTATDPFYDGTSGKMYYSYEENKGFADYDQTDLNGYKSYWLRERSYRSMYLTLPLHLRLRTKEVGMLRYYGNIGINTSIHIRTKADDVVNQLNSGSGSGYQTSTEELQDLVISDDMNKIRLGLALGGGVEYNLSGSTSLMFGLTFFQGFTNAVKKESNYLLDVEKTTDATLSNPSFEYTPVAQEQKFLNNNIAITIGILF